MVSYSYASICLSFVVMYKQFLQFCKQMRILKFYNCIICNIRVISPMYKTSRVVLIRKVINIIAVPSSSDQMEKYHKII